MKETGKTVLAVVLSAWFIMNLANGQEGVSDTMASGNLQTLALLPTSPKIDGSFSVQEWEHCASDLVFISQATGKKALRDTFVFYGQDRDYFYFCHIGDLPPKPQRLSPQDSLELAFTNQKGIFQFSFTPDGGRALPSDILFHSEEHGKLKVAPGVPARRRWVVEMALPWSALGGAAPAVGEVWKMQVTRRWQNPQETAVLDIPELVFSNLMAIARPALYAVNARISGEIRNGGNEKRTAELDFLITSHEAPVSTTAKYETAPQGYKTFMHYFMVGGSADRNMDIKIHDQADGRPLYRRRLDWNVSEGQNFFNPDPPIVLKAGVSPSQRRALAQVSCAKSSKMEDVQQVLFKIVDADDVCRQKVTAQKKGRALYSLDWEFPPLPMGRYSLIAEIVRKDKPPLTLVESFRLMHFPWQNNTIGQERTVPPPFRPLGGTGDYVEALLTGYHASGVFWDAVYAQKENILSSPVSLVFNGKPLDPGAGEWLERSPDRAVRFSRHSGEGLELEATQEYEFDGVCKTTLRFVPRPDVKVSSLYIDIPLKREIARLYHHTAFGIRSNPSEWIPEGEGQVWSLSWNPVKYPSYLWFGEVFKGLCFFTDMTPSAFDNQSGFPSHEILRDGGGVTLRVHLSPPGRNVVASPFTWVCGFQPTPVKPRPASFRNYGMGMWIDAPPDTVMLYTATWYKHFFSDYSFGQPLVPYANDHSWLEYIFNGRQKDESREKIQDRIQALMDKHHLTDRKWEQMFGGEATAFSTLSARMRQGAIFTRGKECGLYLNPRGGHRGWPESEMYDAEWMYSGFFAPDDNHYHRHPVPSYVDMLLFKTREFLRRYPGCRGLYYDNLYPSAKCSPFWGARETAPGKYSFTGDIFAMREMLKRTLRLCHQEGRTLSISPEYAWLIVHMTDANIVPVMGLASVNLGWEMKFGRQDFQDRFPEPFHLVQSLGTQSGTVPLAIIHTTGTQEERLHQHRTLYAVGFAFDLLNFEDSGSREEEGSPLFNGMQKLVRNFGYGKPQVEHFPGYLPQENPVVCNSDTVKITTLKRRDGQLMLLVGNLGGATKVKLQFRGLVVNGLKNAETGDSLHENTLDLSAHDCAVLVGQWQ